MKQLIFGMAMVMAGSVAAADPVEGLWKTGEGEQGGYLHVSVAPCGAEICGTIRAAFDDSGSAVPDYEHLGRQLIWDMKPNGDGSYDDGQIWAPDSDKTYKSRMKLKGGTLEVTGCVAGCIIRRSMDWTRLN